MNWLQFGVQWLHVLLGIMWYGFALGLYFIVSPALAALPAEQGRIAYARLGEIGDRVFGVVGLLVVVLGIMRGTVFGPIDSLETLFGTAYGWTWLVALVATLGLFYTGARRIGPAFEAIKNGPDYAAGVARLRRITRFDLAIFFVVFTCMILMRFGL